LHSLLEMEIRVGLIAFILLQLSSTVWAEAPRCEGAFLSATSKTSISDSSTDAAIEQLAKLKLEIDQDQILNGSNLALLKFKKDSFVQKSQELQLHLPAKNIRDLIRLKIREMQGQTERDKIAEESGKAHQAQVLEDLSPVYRHVSQAMAPAGMSDANSMTIIDGGRRILLHHDGYLRVYLRGANNASASIKADTGVFMKDGKYLSVSQMQYGLLLQKNEFTEGRHSSSDQKPIALSETFKESFELDKAQLSSDERYLLVAGKTASEDRMAVLIDLSTGKEILRRSILSKEFHDAALVGANQLAIIHDKNVLDVLDLTTDIVIKSTTLNLKNGYSPRLDILENGRNLVAHTTQDAVVLRTSDFVEQGPISFSNGFQEGRKFRPARGNKNSIIEVDFYGGARVIDALTQRPEFDFGDIYGRNKKFSPFNFASSADGKYIWILRAGSQRGSHMIDIWERE